MDRFMRKAEGTLAFDSFALAEIAGHDARLEAKYEDRLKVQSI
jgi:hypothetical protein